MNTNINARDYLEKCGIKPSLQRIAIVEYLMENRIHPTADDLYVTETHLYYKGYCKACRNKTAG